MEKDNVSVANLLVEGLMIEETSKAIYKVFEAFVNAGFSREESIDLIKFIVTLAFPLK